MLRAVHAALLSVSLAAAPTTATSPTPAATPIPAADLTALLERSAALDAKLADLFARGSFVVTSTFRTTDQNFGGTKVSEVVTEMYEKDGKPWERITKYVEGGRDVTKDRDAKRQKELASGTRTRKDGIPFRSPFAPGEQKRYRFTAEGPWKDDPALEKIRFEPKGKASTTTYRGYGLVERDTGVVRKLSFRPSAFPRFVKKLDVELEFSTPTPAGLALTSLKVRAGGGALFVIRRAVEVDTTLTGYVMPGTPGTGDLGESLPIPDE